MADLHWSIKKYSKKIKSADITIKRRSIEPAKVIKHRRSPLKDKINEKVGKYSKDPVSDSTDDNIEDIDVKIDVFKEVHTPVRKICFVEPNAVNRIKGSPRTKRYSSSRRIDF